MFRFTRRMPVILVRNYTKPRMENYEGFGGGGGGGKHFFPLTVLAIYVVYCKNKKDSM